jgi:hypothetical protein
MAIYKITSTIEFTYEGEFASEAEEQDQFEIHDCDSDPALFLSTDDE